MKRIICLALAALPLSVLAQQSTNQWAPLAENGVYRSSAEFTTRTLAEPFNSDQSGYRLRNEGFVPTVKIDEPNKPEVKIPMSELWGERKDGVDYRIVDGQLYKVEHTDRVCVYSRPAVFTGSALNTYYFSRTLNSPIHLITSTNLEDSFYDQPARKEAFAALDDLYTKPSAQARELIELFYKIDSPTQAAP